MGTAWARHGQRCKGGAAAGALPDHIRFLRGAWPSSCLHEAEAFLKDANRQLNAFFPVCTGLLQCKLCYLFCAFLSILQRSQKLLTPVRAVLGQGFADASVPFPVVRTEKGAGSHLAFLAGAGCHGALPTEHENALGSFGVTGTYSGGIRVNLRGAPFSQAKRGHSLFFPRSNKLFPLTQNILFWKIRADHIIIPSPSPSFGVIRHARCCLTLWYL